MTADSETNRYHGPWKVTFVCERSGESFSATVDSIAIEHHDQELWSDGTLTGKLGFIGTLHVGSTITLRVGGTK